MYTSHMVRVLWINPSIIIWKKNLIQILHWKRLALVKINMVGSGLTQPFYSFYMQRPPVVL